MDGPEAKVPVTSARHNRGGWGGPGELHRFGGGAVKALP